MSVEFDPVRLGQRRRRVEPAVVGVVLMSVAIVAAIAKPWAPDSTSPLPAASSAADVAGPSSIPTAARTSRPTPGPPDWADISGAVLPHDAWGVTAVLPIRRGATGIPVSPPASRYVERWTPTSTDADGIATAYVNHDDRPIAAIGVTVPSGIQARAVRIWRLHQGDDFEWINAARIDDLAASGAPLLIRLPLRDGVTAEPWGSGQYRLDVLTAGGVHRISVFIPNRFGYVPPPDQWVATVNGLVEARDSDPSAVRIGLFATVDGAAVSIPARVSPPLEEAQAWVDLSDADGSTVAATWMPRATGLGVMLTSHAAVVTASIRRLAPEPLVDAPEPFGGISDAQGRTPFVVFPAPDGTFWAPGVYAITVDWEDAGGPHHGTWHVELRPGTT